MKKHILILGGGTAGAIAACLIKRNYGDTINVSLYYDENNASIGVGEGTFPNIHILLSFMNITIEDLIKNVGSTVKLGIEFKDWIQGQKYFHGFSEIFDDNNMLIRGNSSSLYGIATGSHHGGELYFEGSSSIPKKELNPSKVNYAFHMDGVLFSKYLRDLIKEEVNCISDKAIQIFSNGKVIEGIQFEKSGKVDADFYIDCSGFSSLLLNNLNPEWVDISNILPINKAIPQQVPISKNSEINSFTLAEATQNGWIWQIPVGNRYGTGYLYSSRFTSDEDAKADYDLWLRKNHGVELTSDRIINYRPGYFKDHCIGNCAAIGLSSGFIEPLEATGISLIIQQVMNLVSSGILTNNYELDRKVITNNNRTLYENIVDFVALHYNTNRTDSEFWTYMTNNKSEWVKNFDEKCKNGFINENTVDTNFWGLDCYIQISWGLNMFNCENVINYMNNLPYSESTIADLKNKHESYKKIKEKNKKEYMSHQEFLNQVLKS